MEKQELNSAIEALWPHLMKSKEHPERRFTAYGFKSKADLAEYILTSESVAGAEQEKEPPNGVVVRVDGKLFRCPCGCNVFHHPLKEAPNLYACNSCDTYYEGVKKA